MNGRLRQAMSVLLHSIGVVVVFAGLPRGSRRSIDAVEKARMLCGVQFSNRTKLQTFLPNSGGKEHVDGF